MSAGCFDNASCLLSSYKMNEQRHFPKTTTSSVVEKQGIVSILNNSDSITSNNNKTYPIRRTLSADMSSQKWLQNNGLPHSSVKRVKSSVQLQALGEDESNDHDHDDNKGPAFEEIWSSIQADNKSWGCILSAPKNDGSGSDSGQLPPPYIHPLAKRTASSLSEKSLEICTESLGSETGSDGYSYPPSEPEDSEQEQEEQEEEEEAQQESEVRGYNVEVGIYKYNYNYHNRGPTSKRSMMVPAVRPSSFPPPLPSLAHRDDGSNLRIRTHRQDGRLVVEAVAVPSQNRFRAQRQDGRLLLTFTAHDQPQQQHHDDEVEVADDIETDVQGKNVENEEERGAMVEKDDQEEEEELAIPRGPVGVINVQRSSTALAMTKFMELTSARNNSTWPRNYNKTVIKTLNKDEEEEEEAEEDETDDGVPPMTRPAMSTATAVAVAMNAYEYYWRRQSDNSAVAMLKPLVGAQNNNIYAPQVGKDTERNDNKVVYAAHNRKGGALGQQEEVVIVKTAGRRGGAANSSGEKAEYLVPWMLRGCKEPKKPSLLLWEPCCIATT